MNEMNKYIDENEINKSLNEENEWIIAIKKRINGYLYKWLNV